MRNKLFNFIIIILCLLFFVEIILNNDMVYATICNSLNIWANSLIPSLFPFFIISDILIEYNIITYIPFKIRQFFCKLFNVSENALVVFLLSMISGFPSNARNTRTLYDKGLISRDEASHILMFTHFSNPLFILTTVGVIMFNNKKLGYVILLAHFISNFFLGVLFKNNNKNSKSNFAIKREEKHFGIVLTNSIRHAVDTLLLIFGTLTVFLVISSVIINRFHIGLYPSMIFKGILEITMGIKDLSILNLNDLYKVSISSMLISFGGLSVHMQVISQLVGTDIRYSSFFVGRVCQSIISLFLAIIFYYVIV